MKTKYLVDILKVHYLNANAIGWPIYITLAAGLILLVSIHTNLLDWFWEFIVAGPAK